MNPTAGGLFCDLVAAAPAMSLDLQGVMWGLLLENSRTN